MLTVRSTVQGCCQQTELDNGDLEVIYRTPDGVDNLIVIPKKDRRRIYTVGEFADYIMDEIQGGRSRVVTVDECGEC